MTERFGQEHIPDMAQAGRLQTEEAVDPDPAKVRQILDGAREVFLRLGFDGASMGEVARAAGVSKGTLYVYFENKAELFSALIADERKRAKREFGLDPSHDDIAGALRSYGRNLLAYVSRTRNIQTVRTVVAIAEKFPKVGEDWYRDGPLRGLDHMRTFIEAQVAARRLAVDDSMMAARQLQVLFYAGIVNEMLYGVRGQPDEAEIGRVVDAAVETFLARYSRAR